MTHGAKTLAVTPDALGAAGHRVPWIMFQSDVVNTGKVSIGGPGLALGEGITLEYAGNAVTFPYNPDGYDLGSIRVIGEVAGNILRFVYP